MVTAPNDPTLDQLSIQTGGQTLEGWLTSSVSRGVELMPSNFRISLTERYPNSDNEAIVVPGSPCTVYLGSTLAMSGWIDQYQPAFDGTSHTVTISGRSYPQDVVDSSIIFQSGTAWQINAGDLQSAVQQILQQFPQVKLSYIATPASFNMTVPINPGQTAYSVIEELCRMCSKLLWDDQNGNLVISDVGTQMAGSALVEGSNVEAAAVVVDWTERFSKIMVCTTGQVPGSTINNPVIGTATDPTGQIRQERVKLIPMDGYLGPDQSLAQQQANWEMNRRIGRSLIVRVTVTGWRDGAGNLWTPNTICNVQLPTLKVSCNLVISECEWQRDENGTRTIITLMPAGALQPAPFIPPIQLGQGSSTTG